MSKEYIEKALLMRRIENESRLWGDEYEVSQVLGDIEDFPPADVKPVIKGDWEEVEVRQYGEICVASMRCSECKKYHNEVYFYGNPTEDRYFCPNCGADMRK